MDIELKPISEKGGISGSVLAAVAGVVIAIALVAVAFILLKRKRAGSTPSEGETQKPPQKPET